MTDPHLFPPVWEAFRGYTREDVAFIRLLAAPPCEPVPGAVVDFLGMRFFPEDEPVPPEWLGRVVTSPPFPTDGLYSEGIEYAALALSLQGGRPGYDIMELGAGFGPWATLGALCARRLGKGPVRITAVEADPARFAHMRRHLEHNGLVPAAAPRVGSGDGFDWQLEQAIVWPEDGEAYWIDSVSHDSGRRAMYEAPADDRDYRGLQGKVHAHRALSLPTLLEGRTVDLLHMDIQGSEAEVIASATEALNEHVRFLFVGTHSREIEGRLIAGMARQWWLLEREVPCEFQVDPSRQDVQTYTTRDGGQVWRNPRLT